LKSKTEYYDDGIIPWLRSGEVAQGFVKKSELFITEKGLKNSSAKLLPVGTLLFTSRATIGEIKISIKQVSTNQGFKNLIPKACIDGDFLFYQILKLKNEFVKYAAGSTFLEINRKDTGRVMIPHPVKMNEQEKIGTILKNIDQTIEKTEALIEKYQQIKAGLMHDLFTRGIGADGKLRPPCEQSPELYQQTPIGWIPKDWGLCKLAELADICSGVTLGSMKTSDQIISVPYLRVANVQDGYLDLTDVKEVMVSMKTFDTLLLKAGDVLMNEGGDFDKLGRGAVWQGEIEPCIHQNHVFRVRTNDQILRHYFLAYWSQSVYGKKYFVLSSKQSTNLASINSTQLKKFPVVLPSLNEQLEIEKRIDTINLKINMLNYEHSKHQKQKSGLMHDLLTGKVQVNTEVTHAPTP
jgi:type I restriction enzyme S subunit